MVISLLFLTGNCNIITHVVTQTFVCVCFLFCFANLLVLFFSIVTLVVLLKTVVSDRKRSRDEQPSVALLTFRMITDDEKVLFLKEHTHVMSV